MWCRILDIGAHHACRLLLQALFMTASVLTVTSKIATRTMTKGLFMATACPPASSLTEFSSFKNELRVNVWRALVRCAAMPRLIAHEQLGWLFSRRRTMRRLALIVSASEAGRRV